MEVNMRPAGGHDPVMMNFAQSIDVFRIYAEMVTSDRRLYPGSGERYLCAYAARKDGHTFSHSHEEIMEEYGSAIVMQEEMPPIDWPSMGRYVYMARFRKISGNPRLFNCRDESACSPAQLHSCRFVCIWSHPCSQAPSPVLVIHLPF